MNLFEKFFKPKEELKINGEDKEKISEEKGEKGISRRDFLKISRDAAIVGAGIGLGLKPESAEGGNLIYRYPDIKTARNNMEKIREEYDKYINTYILNIRHREIPFRTDTGEETERIMEKKKYLLTEEEVRAVILVESDGNKNKISNINKGETIKDIKRKKDKDMERIAFGLMQVKKEAAEEIKGEKIEKENLEELLDPEKNIFYGIEYLQKLMFRFKDKNLAFLAYNIGPKDVEENIREYEKSVKDHKYVRLVHEVLNKVI